MKIQMAWPCRRPACAGQSQLGWNCVRRADRTRIPTQRPCKRLAASGPGSEGHPTILFSMESEHNSVVVLQFPESFPMPEWAGCRGLMVDKSRNLHSVYCEGRVLLGDEFYWEHLAIAAAGAPEGPIGVLGLGTGTVARIVHRYWPRRSMHGWELDGVVLHAGRLHMGLQALEDAGALVSHTGDALSPDATVAGGFAGLIIDLFAEGAAIPPLFQADAWRGLRRRLRPDGVCVANLGAAELAGAAAQQAQAAFADVGVHIKQTGGNLLLFAGADPCQPAGAVHADLDHILDGWRPAAAP